MEFKENLNNNYPVTKKSNDNLFAELIDACEELFNEKYLYLKPTNRIKINEFDKPIITTMHDVLTLASRKKNYEILKNFVYLEYRLKEVKLKLKKISINLMLSLLYVYTVHFKRIKSLSKLTTRERTAYNKGVKSFIHEIELMCLSGFSGSGPLLNNNLKNLLFSKSNDLFYLGKIIENKSTLFSNLCNNFNTLYLDFILANHQNPKISASYYNHNGIFMMLKNNKNFNVHNKVRSMALVYFKLVNDIKLISKMIRAIRTLYYQIRHKNIE